MGYIDQQSATLKYTAPLPTLNTQHHYLPTPPSILLPMGGPMRFTMRVAMLLTMQATVGRHVGRHVAYNAGHCG
jgi:hypothetical protein